MGGGCTRVNVGPALLPCTKKYYIYSFQKCTIIDGFWVPRGKQLLPLVSGLGSEKAVLVLGNA